MAETIYGDGAVADKAVIDRKLLAVLAVMREGVHPMIISTDLVTPDQLVRLYATIDACGMATLGECMAAMQPHDRPVAALISLAEMGLLEFDRGSDFDEYMTVWRIR